MKKVIGGVVTAVVMVVVVILLAMSTVRVPAGYIAVQYSMSGGIKGDVLTQGWHVKSPTVKTTLYSVSLEQSYLTAGKDGDSKQCDDSGKIVGKQTVVAPHKVRIRRIIANIWNDAITIKYKIDAVDDYINVRNRGESSLFKTLDECEQKCKEINQGESGAAF